MSDKFRLVMDAVDEDLLEEAVTPARKKKFLYRTGVAVAACLMLVLGTVLARGRLPGATAEELYAMGYVIDLPEDARHIRYEILTLAEGDAVQASFQIREDAYLCRGVKTQERLMLSGSAEAEADVLSWNTGAVDIQLLSSASGTSVSWYVPEDETQWYLTAQVGTEELLTVASHILEATGLDVTVAPETAENVTYDVFRLGDLTVAETTFAIDGITYAYRMAATAEIREDFADISGMEGPFAREDAGEVLWCAARIGLNEGGQGKIIWFDVVPGILYSLSAESGASAEMLQDMAEQLFEPAQDNA